MAIITHNKDTLAIGGGTLLGMGLGIISIQILAVFFFCFYS